MTVIRRSGVDAARSALEKAEASLETERAALAETEATLEAANARRDELVDDEGAYRANEDTIAELRKDLGRRRRAIGKREGELEAAQAALRRAEWEDARAELERACTTNAKRSGAVSETLERLAGQLADVERTRAKVAELETKVTALAPDDVDDPLEGMDLDEPSWPEIDEALEVVTEGPRRPLARMAEAVARQEVASEQAAANRIATAVREWMQHGFLDRIKALPPELLPRAVEAAERHRDAEVERLTNATADSPFAGAGKRTAAVVEQFDRRVGRIRELAEQVEAAA